MAVRVVNLLLAAVGIHLRRASLTVRLGPHADKKAERALDTVMLPHANDGRGAVSTGMWAGATRSGRCACVDWLRQPVEG
jgi:hypothetical protein